VSKRFLVTLRKAVFRVGGYPINVYLIHEYLGIGVIS